MTLEDLSAYETLLTDPLIGEFNGYDVISAPAPFGGMTLIQMLKMGEILEIPDPDTDPFRLPQKAYPAYAHLRLKSDQRGSGRRSAVVKPDRGGARVIR